MMSWTEVGWSQRGQYREASWHLCSQSPNTTSPSCVPGIRDVLGISDSGVGASLLPLRPSWYQPEGVPGGISWHATRWYASWTWDLKICPPAGEPSYKICPTIYWSAVHTSTTNPSNLNWTWWKKRRSRSNWTKILSMQKSKPSKLI